MNRVYLCGPISGLYASEATGWREEAEKRLTCVYDAEGDFVCERDTYITVLNPMRDKTNLPAGRLPPEGFTHLGPLCTGRGILGRDRNDVRTSNVVLANFTGAPHVSIGSMIELGWADAWGIPVVAILDKHHNHVFVREIATAICKDLDEAVKVTLSILGV